MDVVSHEHVFVELISFEQLVLDKMVSYAFLLIERFKSAKKNGKVEQGRECGHLLETFVVRFEALMGPKLEWRSRNCRLFLG